MRMGMAMLMLILMMVVMVLMVMMMMMNGDDSLRLRSFRSKPALLLAEHIGHLSLRLRS